MCFCHLPKVFCLHTFHKFLISYQNVPKILSHLFCTSLYNSTHSPWWIIYDPNDFPRAFVALEAINGFCHEVGCPKSFIVNCSSSFRLVNSFSGGSDDWTTGVNFIQIQDYLGAWKFNLALRHITSHIEVILRRNHVRFKNMLC